MWFQAKQRFYNLDRYASIVDETTDLQQTPRARLILPAGKVADIVEGDDAYRLINLMKRRAEGDAHEQQHGGTH